MFVVCDFSFMEIKCKNHWYEFVDRLRGAERAPRGRGGDGEGRERGGAGLKSTVCSRTGPTFLKSHGTKATEIETIESPIVRLAREYLDWPVST